MSTSEPARVALYNRLGEVIGPEHAGTLMTSLPLQPAVELATKADIERLDARIDALATEMRAGFRDIHKALRHQMIATIGAMTAMTGIFSLIVGLMV
ncbi:MAG: hypothetical protein U9N56_01690 [Actinomycetota bacterium]|nr:hypothetical protein [Actinomycetota bacterium]